MKVSILGFGTVGKGVYDMLRSTASHLPGLVLVRPGKCTMPFMTSSIEDIVRSDSDAAVECIGGVEPAYDYVCMCLNAKKSVVTSNKALVAEKGIELAALARKNNVSFLFSAACGGAIPVLSSINIAVESDEMISCEGIMNGTTNFILSGMKNNEFSSYQQALAQAQKLGYAESDPTADVSGLDTVRKASLLSCVSFGVIPCGELLHEGIENIDLLKDRTLTVKLLGFSGRNENGSVYVFSEPVICKTGSAYGSVNSNYNLISYTGKSCGKISLSGQGAGMYPTASSVLRDISSINCGIKEMIRPFCRKECADNSLLKHRYLVCTENESFQTGYVSVSQMHSDMRKLREEGKKVFFASLEE